MSSAPSPRLRRALSLSVLGATAVALCLGLAGAFATPGAVDWDLVSLGIPVVAFASVGGLVSLRLPGNAIGWIMAAIGLLFSLVVFASGSSRWALSTGDLPRRMGEWLDVPSSAWVIALGLIGTQLPLRLPNGRLPSPRWRWFSRTTIGLIGLSFAAALVQPGRLEGVEGTRSPLAISGSEPLFAVFPLVILCFLGGAASLWWRYRSAAADERAQLRWVALGGVVFVGVYVLTLLVGAFEEDTRTVATTVTTLVSQAGFAALPIAIGYAVRRHGLYDIDAVIHRALVYTALTVTLVAAYLITVLLAQLVLPARSDLAVAVSTLAVAAAFRPVRERVQADVDRRFFRRRYDAQRTVETFAVRLREQVDLTTLDAELRRAVADSVQPAHVSIWLRDR